MVVAQIGGEPDHVGVDAGNRLGDRGEAVVGARDEADGEARVVGGDGQGACFGSGLGVVVTAVVAGGEQEKGGQNAHGTSKSAE